MLWVYGKKTQHSSNTAASLFTHYQRPEQGPPTLFPPQHKNTLNFIGFGYFWILQKQRKKQQGHCPNLNKFWALQVRHRSCKSPTLSGPYDRLDIKWEKNKNIYTAGTYECIKKSDFKVILMRQSIRSVAKTYLCLNPIIAIAQVLQVCSCVGLHGRKVVLQHVNHLCQLWVTPRKLPKIAGKVQRYQHDSRGKRKVVSLENSGTVSLKMNTSAPQGKLISPGNYIHIRFYITIHFGHTWMTAFLLAVN